MSIDTDMLARLIFDAQKNSVTDIKTIIDDYVKSLNSVSSTEDSVMAFPQTVIIKISDILYDRHDYPSLYNFLNLNQYHQRILLSSKALQKMLEGCLWQFLDHIFWGMDDDQSRPPITQAVCDYAVTHVNGDRWFSSIPTQFLTDRIVEIAFKEDARNLQHIERDDMHRFLYVIENILYRNPHALRYVTDTRLLSDDVLKSVLSRDGMLLECLDHKPKFLIKIAIANHPHARQYAPGYRPDPSDD